MHPDAPHQPDIPESDAAAPGRRGWTMFALALTAVAVVVLASLAWIFFLGGRLPELAAEDLESAIDRWEQSGVRSYTMDLEISGQRAGNVHAEVENGVVVRLVRDGHTPRERRTWDVWSVPGQFDMIQRGLEIAANPVREIQAAQGAQVLVRAEFDEQLGYPLEFSQVTLGGGPEFAWKLVRFERR